MAEEYVLVPNAEVLFGQLMEICDHPHLVRYLYPHILRRADTELDPEGAVFVLTFAFSACLSGLADDHEVRQLRDELFQEYLRVLMPKEKMFRQAEQFLGRVKK